MQDVDYKDEKVEYDLRSIDEQVAVEEEPIRRDVDEYQFTWRSAIVGSLLGCLIGNELQKF